MPIPDDVVEHFKQLEQMKIELSGQEKFKKNTFLYKDKYLMWEKFPELNGLPSKYLNQLMILVNMLHGYEKCSIAQVTKDHRMKNQDLLLSSWLVNAIKLSIRFVGLLRLTDSLIFCQILF